MFELSCSVRNCLRPLTLRDNGLFCDASHHFDRARQGYWNLLQPQDSRSADPGDSEDAVTARNSWLARGHVAGLIAMLRTWVLVAANQRESIANPKRALDLGCGEGTFGQALFADRAWEYCGIDLSKRAIRLATRTWPDATWVLANADRTLPVASESVDYVISLFGRRPISEVVHGAKPGGYFCVAVPGETDLIELREQVQASGHRRSRTEVIVADLEPRGMRCIESARWEHSAHLSPDAIAEALAMTYRAVRFSQQAVAAQLNEMDVTLSADLLLFQKT